MKEKKLSDKSEYRCGNKINKNKRNKTKQKNLSRLSKLTSAQVFHNKSDFISQSSFAWIIVRGQMFQTHVSWWGMICFGKSSVSARFYNTWPVFETSWNRAALLTLNGPCSFQLEADLSSAPFGQASIKISKCWKLHSLGTIKCLLLKRKKNDMFQTFKVLWNPMCLKTENREFDGLWNVTL